MKYERCRMLMGDDFEKLRKAKILLLGVGGVGSFCLDCLVRSGVEDITIVDFDKYDITNQNRQIGSDKVGAVKVHRLAELYPTVTPIEAKIDDKWIENFDFSSFDLVLDAIDDIRAKITLAHKVSPKLISATGGARKLDPTKIEIASIWKTHGDPFARKIRYELKKSGFKGDFPALFSPEEPKCQTKGSFVGVTGSFGLAMCSAAIQKIINKD
ncbi:tRNA threonylcarbamoyladenosine dehydratase [Hydrogenimonas thermophila]|uniref:tRNA A37 threonylcarbamoyladenosine dehydratase n=1 Tax=Hydrogenimonas thermophila TaxID=223786 RepID=A0A1I5MAV1_9BACT|nr:tRNA threonylcarbamoyladenosine dehydratase [Hydrogenimonas thermophila]WOE70630.1 tRNA threonylcarbamoyladenosine dehydratase [Hydrogenimonas thermophila]WOE73148.1 tRNA threonylcarbamoyladenosine dehydratase [Hydrogenimonas thermophila]SFP06758.1 tRNA A37 threonylcarbamoyladenosine dehydratase [Hydrogenimonas thermophila]